ncbi:hypothetical protein BS78_03G376900 [Paspalum vaginatum]|nr:hypothetical protein BS78_03G376900 [Paspalum vaginatum]
MARGKGGPTRAVANPRERLAKFEKRKVGLQTKAAELVSRCAVDVAVVCTGPGGEGGVDYWPSKEGVSAVVRRYKAVGQAQRARHTEDRADYFAHRLAEEREKLTRAREGRPGRRTRVLGRLARGLARGEAPGAARLDRRLPGGRAGQGPEAATAARRRGRSRHVPAGSRARRRGDGEGLHVRDEQCGAAAGRRRRGRRRAWVASQYKPQFAQCRARGRGRRGRGEKHRHGRGCRRRGADTGAAARRHRCRVDAGPGR